MICLICGLLTAAQAQVGIGTTNPSNNAVLDLSSTNKGMLLPRVNDTSSVNNPSAGLMIYNKNTNSPAFHNGKNWSTLISTSSLAGALMVDSVIYSISGPGSGEFTQGNFQALSLAIAGTNSGGSQPAVDWSGISLTKTADINSNTFLKKLSNGEAAGQIEFTVYVAGSSQPRLSVKLNNWVVTSSQLGMGAGLELTENMTLGFGSNGVIGFKDWVNNKSFSYNIATKTFGPY